MLHFLLLGCSSPAVDVGATPPLDDPSPDTVGGRGTGDPSLLCQARLACEGNIQDEPKVPCDLEIVSGDGVVVYEGRAGVELRGRSSLGFPKPQYSLELRAHSALPIWPGFVWHYLDDGSDPGPDWMEPDFDDSAWAEGSAPLGYGVEGLNTVVNAGADPDDVHPTTYFRYTFGPASSGAVTGMRLGVRRNDAVAVYLNGIEVLRENLSPTADYESLALAPITADAEVLWLSVDVPATLLDGQSNVVGAEVHQAARDSTDARFDLYLDATGDTVDSDLFGMGRHSDWILNGNYTDRSLFRNKLALDTFQSFGDQERYGAESVFCEVELDGAYLGVYSLGESIKRAEGRIDLPGSGTPGDDFVIKLDSAEGFHPNAVGVGTWQMVYPKDDPEAELAASAFLTGWEAEVLDGDDADEGEGQFAYLDMASAVDWVLLQEFMKNADAYQYSVHLWRREGGTAFFSPWDFDLSMGYPYTDCGATGWLWRLAYIDSMAADPEFQMELARRWAELRADELSEARILARIAAYDATLAPGIARNFERWPIEDIAFAYDGVDNWLCPVESYADEHARVLEFIRARLAWMDENIANY